MEKKLVLIDGYGFLFRAYYAIKVLKRSDGVATNAIYGFTRMMLNLLVDLQATHIAIVFDVGKKTFRSELYGEYKANRPPAPDDLVPQFAMAREVADALNIITIEKEGYEADDVIATLAKAGEKEGYEVLVVSSDKDLMQLVSDNIFIYDAMKQVKLDKEAVLAKWGVEPSKVLDVLSLMGDNIDNVPGVPGIGVKTAISLVQQYGSVDNLIQKIDSMPASSRKTSLQEHLEDLKLSKQLVALEYNVDLPLKLDDLAVKDLDPIKFRDYLRKQEFYSIAKQVEKTFNLATVAENDIFSLATNVKKNCKKIIDFTMLKECCSQLQSKDRIFFEILTENSDDYNNIKIVTLADEENSYSIQLNEEVASVDLFGQNETKNNSGLQIKEALNLLKPLLENESLQKISYNVKKQLRLLMDYDIALKNYDDIGVISYVLDSGKFTHTLGKIAFHHLQTSTQFSNLEDTCNALEMYEKGKNISAVNSDIFSFACDRIKVVAQLYDILAKRLESSGLANIYSRIEKPIIEVLASMEYSGVRIDIGALNDLSSFFLAKISDLEAEIFEMAGMEFNINSPKQLGEVLFDKLNLTGSKKSKSGGYSTDAEILEGLDAEGHSIAGKVLEYRHFTKLKNTYTDVLPKLIDKNNRVHTTYSNTYVITGRLSSNNPNLQNIPIRSEESLKIRKAFVARAGYKLIGADYSQIELRVLSEYAKVKELIRAFQNNEDVHEKTAKRIFGVNDIDREMRRVAKIINFSLIYGATAYSIAKRLNTSNSKAKEYIDSYFNTYPEIKEYMSNIVDFARKNGYVETLFGRRCYIDVNSGAGKKAMAERLAINAPIQGTEADIIKLAMIKLHQALKGQDAKILLQVHDELLLEVKEEKAEEVKDLVVNIMENVVKYSIPLKVDANIGNNWGEIH